jgi:hypothetical protein
MQNCVGNTRSLFGQFFKKGGLTLLLVVVSHFQGEFLTTNYGKSQFSTLLPYQCPMHEYIIISLGIPRFVNADRAIRTRNHLRDN